jgi:hypothetical protein
MTQQFQLWCSVVATLMLSLTTACGAYAPRMPCHLDCLITYSDSVEPTGRMLYGTLRRN